MPAPMVKTRHPGIFKRGSRYVVVYRVDGKQRKESARTLDEARAIKRARETDRDRGELTEQSKVTFAAYALEWVDRYQGNGRRGFREHTRTDYRRDLERYAIPFFDGRLSRTVSQVTPRDVAQWIAWLCDEDAQRERIELERERADDAGPRNAPARLSDATVRRIMAPVRSCFATAVREGLIRHNPCVGAALPHREQIVEDDQEHARALTREQLSQLLAVAQPRWRPLFEFLAATGLRWSECVELRWRDLRLDGSTPHVRVRRALVRGTVGPPKSKHSRRDVPLSLPMADALAARRRESDWGRDDDLVWSNLRGGTLDHSMMLRKYLRPPAGEAGVPWVGFHTFRHTCASLLFDRGENAVKVQRWLGHHSPAFTLATYVHLLDDTLGDGLTVVERPAQASSESTSEMLRM